MWRSGEECPERSREEFLWNVFSQTMTVGLKPVALPEGIGIYGRLRTPQCGVNSVKRIEVEEVERSTCDEKISQETCVISHLPPRFQFQTTYFQLLKGLRS